MNILKRILFSLLAILLVFPTFAQSWSKLKKEGETYAADGFYLEAGEAYYKAWKQKPEKLELAFQAGTYFTLVKEYAQAAESLKPVAHWNQPEKLCGLKYARALKQSGDHKKAIPAFESFISAYSGADKVVMEGIVHQEIEGSRLAMMAEETTDFHVIYPGNAINSSATDFSPALFGEDVVYFSSTKSGMSRLYRSLKQNDKWGKPETPKGLPEDPTKHIANGSFSSDGQLFYYTVCGQTDLNKQRTRCEIYVMVKRGTGWNSPERLPDYINTKESNQTHPTTAIINEKEFIFFASDRPGGEGGMDIWYISRDKNSRDLDFSIPLNAGKPINTLGDDQMPYFDEGRRRLYFSSNGQVSFGGFDIYGINGYPGQWSDLDHLGRPLNSEADDLYFRLNIAGTSGFMVSNRLEQGQRTHTRDEDLFYINSRPADHVVYGKVFDRMSEQLLQPVRVYAYYVADGEKVVFQSLYSETGEYELTIPGKIDAYVIAEKPEYEQAAYRIKYKDAIENRISHDFFMLTETMPDEAPIVSTPAPKISEPQNKPVIAKTEPKQPDAETALVETNKLPEQPIVEAKPTETQKESAAEIAVSNAPDQNTSGPATDKPDKSGKFHGLTPYKNKVRTPPASTPSNPSPSKPKQQTELVVADNTPIEKPKPVENPIRTEKPKPSPPKSSEVGTSLNRDLAADASLFTGEGLEKRYKGKRVDKRKYETEAEAFEGIYYRIQLEATDNPSRHSTKYERLKDLGELETESLSNPGLSRVVIGVFRTVSEAQNALNISKLNGFNHAFIVRYEDGIRLRRWK